MNSLTATPELTLAAKRCVWFMPAEQAIADPIHLAAHILTYGQHEDVQALRAQMDDDALRAALENAPPGVFDGRSWAYWHVMLDRYPPPPLPQRKLPA